MRCVDHLILSATNFIEDGQKDKELLKYIDEESEDIGNKLAVLVRSGEASRGFIPG